jgi:hypothetical protein
LLQKGNIVNITLKKKKPKPCQSRQQNKNCNGNDKQNGFPFLLAARLCGFFKKPCWRRLVCFKVEVGKFNA